MMKFIILSILVTLVYGKTSCADGCKANNMVCNIDTDTCMCLEGYTGEKCEIDCDITLTGQKEISIPRNHYNEHVHCIWANDPSKVTTVSVVMFDLEYDVSCSFDYLRVLEKEYCGNMQSNSMPRSFVLRGDDTIEFVTDRSDKADGFKLFLSYSDAITKPHGGNGKSTPVPNCPLKPIAGKPHFYLIAGLVRPCAKGTVFSLFHCTCIHENTL